MNKKCTKVEIEQLAKSRHHTLLKMENYVNIKSKICLGCYTCKNEFETSLCSYKNATKTGCPYCKKRAILDTHKNKRVNQETKTKISQKNKKKSGTLNRIFGKDHPRWKGGQYNRLKKPSTEAYFWKQSIKQLYNYKCALTDSLLNLQCHPLES